MSPLPAFCQPLSMPHPRPYPTKRSTSHAEHHAYACRTVVACARDPSVAFVLSHFEARDLLDLRKNAKPDECIRVHGAFSVDLGLRTLESIVVRPDGISVNSNQEEAQVLATWHELKKMSKKGKSGAFEVFLDGTCVPERIAGLSEGTSMPFSLLPIAPEKPPTLILGGFGMHRMKGTDPAADTASKMAAIGPQHLRGSVLDICTGLGYTAIEAARAPSVDNVTTVELDPMVIEVQRRNPWSRALFSDPKIIRRVGDATTLLPDFPDGSFEVVIHDPPAQALGGDLYSADFYKQLARVCVRGAKLFHYIGEVGSTESGRLFRGVMNRLEAAGFHSLEVCVKAYGVTAVRG